MKNVVVFILAFLLFVPPVQAHADVIFLDVVEEHQLETYKDNHQLQHHEQDGDTEKNTEHHHHCTLLGFSSAVVFGVFDYNIVQISQEKSQILFYQKLHTTDYLEGIFQPPKAY